MNTNELQKIKQRFGIIGNSPALNKAIEIAVRVANTHIGVLITGENGSGKESFAKIIHELGTQRHGNFIAVNCGAIPEGTIDSELFGHERGAFTSASETRKGYFEESDNGSIFLDEIGEMPLHTQPRLLRVLENKEYLRVGSSQKRFTNARVIAATNVDLQACVAQKKFREDLYYRIAQVEISIPPLRERGEDIYLLFRKFVLDFAHMHKTPLMQLTPLAQQMLMSYEFPGNIRQLKNITWQLGTFEAENSVVTETILEKYLPTPIIVPASKASNNKNTHVAPAVIHEKKEMLYKIIVDMQQEIQEIKKVILDFIQQKINSKEIIKQHPQLFRMLMHPIASQITNNTHAPKLLELPTKKEISNIQDNLSLKDQEEKLIREAIAKTKTHKEAANLLGISLRTLFRKIKQYNNPEESV